ncbi:MAG: type II secretion system F family protein, partial [Candidatus Marinimicrobia bacterium]|nr:type II secretion system F family protein [Candidatus Neomarinimicrobiota bacterium]
MDQFRYTAVSLQGKRVQGAIEAKNQKEAKKTAQEIAAKRKLAFQSIEKKVTYIYRAKRTGQEITTGEQSAYSKEELQQALERLGFKVLKIQRKLFDFKGKVPATEVTGWIRLCADLLEENLPYDEI